eukprot:14201260-Ditylum_brightwellii.AAC.1
MSWTGGVYCECTIPIVVYNSLFNIERGVGDFALGQWRGKYEGEVVVEMGMTEMVVTGTRGQFTSHALYNKLLLKHIDTS